MILEFPHNPVLTSRLDVVPQTPRMRKFVMLETLELLIEDIEALDGFTGEELERVEYLENRLIMARTKLKGKWSLSHLAGVFGRHRP